MNETTPSIEQKTRIVNHNIQSLIRAGEQINPSEIIQKDPYIYRFSVEPLIWKDPNLQFPKYELKLQLFEVPDSVLQLSMHLVGLKRKEIEDDEKNEVYIGTRKTIFLIHPSESHLSPATRILAKQNKLMLVHSILKTYEPQFEGNGIGQGLAQLSTKGLEILKTKLDTKKYELILAYVIDAAKPVAGSLLQRDRWTTNLVEQTGYEKDVGKDYFSWEFIQDQRTTWDRVLVKVLQDQQRNPTLIF